MTIGAFETFVPNVLLLRLKGNCDWEGMICLRSRTKKNPFRSATGTAVIGRHSLVVKVHAPLGAVSFEQAKADYHLGFFFGLRVDVSERVCLQADNFQTVGFPHSNKIGFIWDQRK